MPTTTAKQLNFCRTCGSDFTSMEGFDFHRVGAYGGSDFKGHREDWSPEQGRRCLTADELLGKGYAQDERGRWFSVERRDAARRAFGLSASLGQRHRAVQEAV